MFTATQQSFTYSPITRVWLQTDVCLKFCAVTPQERLLPSVCSSIGVSIAKLWPVLKKSDLLYAVAGGHAKIGSHESSVAVGMGVKRFPRESSPSLKCSRYGQSHAWPQPRFYFQPSHHDETAWNAKLTALVLIRLSAFEDLKCSQQES